jgi:hypothetical protein
MKNKILSLGFFLAFLNCGVPPEAGNDQLKKSPYSNPQIISPLQPRVPKRPPLLPLPTTVVPKSSVYTTNEIISIAITDESVVPESEITIAVDETGVIIYRGLLKDYGGYRQNQITNAQEISLSPSDPDIAGAMQSGLNTINVIGDSGVVATAYYFLDYFPIGFFATAVPLEVPDPAWHSGFSITNNSVVTEPVLGFAMIQGAFSMLY